jgi:hypothetical protein
METIGMAGRMMRDEECFCLVFINTFTLAIHDTQAVVGVGRSKLSRSVNQLGRFVHIFFNIKINISLQIHTSKTAHCMSIISTHPFFQ